MKEWRRSGIGLTAACLLLVVGTSHAQQATAPPAKRIAIRAGRLIDGKSEAPIINALILIEGDKIVSVSAGGNAPAGADLIDLSKHTVLPGLVDAHTHVLLQGDVTAALAKVSLPAGASTSTGGVFAQLSSLLTQFAVAILAAIVLVYLIMVATFRSLLKPLVLLVSIPFAASGAIVALVVTRTSLSLPGMIGLLMLIGIVVTNAIVLLDLVEQYRDRGLSLHDALIEGGRHRLRPILMTAFATMLALVPLAVSGNSGGAFISAPLAIVVIGGLFTSTLLTLILVPVLYSIASRFTGPRSTRDLDEMFDAAQDRRFKPIGGRGSGAAAAAIASDGAGKTYTVTVTLEPEPGRMGDRAVLDGLTANGLSVAPMPNSAKVRVTIPGVDATSESEAKNTAIARVVGIIPKEGYVVSSPELNVDGEPALAGMAQTSA
jgi:hypothetical protein